MSKKNTRKNNSDYQRGKRWGFAVMTAATHTDKGAVMKADKAMQTCAKNARTGCKRLTVSERNAYRGIADGMYDALKVAERKSR